MHTHEESYRKNFAETYTRYSGFVTRRINYVLMDPDASEEVSQDLFMKLYEKKTPLDPDSPTMKSFLNLVAKHRAIDYMKIHHREKVSIVDSPVENLTCDDDFYTSMEESYIEGEIISTLHDSLEELPATERHILVQKYFHKKTLKQISCEIDCSSTTITKLFRNAKRLLRRKLTARYSP